MTQSAQIIGHMTYREGDGAEIVIRPGACEVEINEIDVTLSWVDDEDRLSTAIPRIDFDRHVREGTLKMAG